MTTMNRRAFIGKAAMGAGAVIVLSHLPESLLANARYVNMPIGFQTWSVKDQLAKDFTGTMKMMADQGYQITEMCYPKGYKDAGFGSLVSMKTTELRKMIEDAGLTCPSCHFGFHDLTDGLDEAIDFASELGLTQMICSSFGLPKTATLNDYLEAADKMNKAADRIKKAGIQAGYHNHDMEFAKLNGKLIYDELMGRFDPDLVMMQFQTEVINLGYKAADYFNKYPGRFISSHLSDWTADKKEVPIGKGVIDWKEFFTAAQKGGVRNFFVEMSPETFKDSAEYIKSVSVA